MIERKFDPSRFQYEHIRADDVVSDPHRRWILLDQLLQIRKPLLERNRHAEFFGLQSVAHAHDCWAAVLVPLEVKTNKRLAVELADVGGVAGDVGPSWKWLIHARL